MTRRPARINNAFVQLASIGRRSLAVMASLVLLVGSFVPAAHVHFAVSPAGWQEPVRVHQHLEPHRVAAGHHHAHLPDSGLWNDDDHDGVVLTIDHRSLVPDSAGHHAQPDTASSAIAFVPPLDHAARVQTSPATISPPEPVQQPASLRAPPSIA